MARALGWLFKSLAVIFVSLLLVVLSFGYVNDARVNLPDIESIKPHKDYWQKSASVFSANLSHRLQAGPVSWDQAVEETSKAHKQILTTHSARFVSPYQVYAVLGSYPSRLDGNDAIFIPSGSELLISPNLEGEQRLDFLAAAFFGDAEIKMSIDGMDFGAQKLEGVSEPQDRKTFWYRNVGRFWNVDKTEKGGEWKPVSQIVNLSKTSELKLACISKAAHCVVSDPSFYIKGKSTKPNTILVMVDTMRADALNKEAAPFLSQWSEQSLRFDRAMAAGNMTSPSTNSMLACRKPSDLRQIAFAYNVPPEKRQEYYNEQKASFPDAFQKNNFDTTMIGNVSVISEVMDAGVSHGFSRQISLETEGYETPHLTRDAIDWLGREGNKPFFLYLHFNAPHAAYRAPLRDLFATFPGWKAFGSRHEFLSWMYKAEIHFTDRYIEKLFAAVEKMGLEKDTTIMLAADHGDHFTPHKFSYNKIGKQLVGSFYDHGATLLHDEIQVPLVLRPASFVANKAHAISDNVSLLDVGPTLMDFAGISPLGYCDGMSLKAYADASTLEKANERILGTEGYGRRGVVFGNRYKYIRAYSPIKKKVFAPGDYGGEMAQILIDEELFDMAKDPQEKLNLAFTDESLLEQGRKSYDQFYDIQSEYELVLENPTPVGYRIWMQSKADLTLPENSKAIEFSDGVRVLGDLQDRITIRIRQWRPGKITVNFENDKQEILLTSLALPIDLSLVDRLPREFLREDKKPQAITQPRVYLRRIIRDEIEDREIVAGNPQFEEILREWGYLNDNT